MKVDALEAELFAGVSARHVAEFGGRVLLAVGGASYLIGLVIVNFRLQSYGVVGISLARAEYISAGLLWLAFALVGFSCVRIARYTIQALLEYWRQRRRLLATAMLFTGVFSVSIILIVSMVAASGGTASRGWRSTTFILVAAAVILLTPVTLLSMANAIRGAWRNRSDADRLDERLLSLTFSTVAVLVALFLYAQIAYPMFLPVFGGGRLSPVTLHLTAQDASILDSARSRSVPRVFANRWYVVTETPDWIVVTDTDPLSSDPFTRRVAVRLRRDIVRAAASGPLVFSTSG